MFFFNFLFIFVVMMPNARGDGTGSVSVARLPSAGENRSRLLVTYKKHVSKFARGVQIGSSISKVDIEDAENADAIMERLLKSEDVESVEFDALAYALNAPTDPAYGQQWYLSAINAPEAWDIATGSDRVRVCVVDTGVDAEHPDLIENLKGVAEEPVDRSFRNSYSDSNGHGTHVVGTIGATANNNIGVSGVNWNADVISCKFMNDKGAGYISDAIDCYNWCVVKNNAQIVSSSWATPTYSEALRLTMESLGEEYGAVFVTAAGNEGKNNDDSPKAFPASYNLDNQINVAAINQEGALASFSNYGIETTHIAAPGVRILSTTPNNGYHFLSGTSMAAPIVSGALALMADASQGKISAIDLRNILLESSKTDSSLNDFIQSGRSLDLHAAVQAARDAALSIE